MVCSVTMKKNTDIRKACNNCIKAKAACDNNRPCFRCISHKLADSCANVARKHNVSKRRRTVNGMSGDSEDSTGEMFINNSFVIPPPSGDINNLSSIINHSINNIITNIDNSVTQNNYYMPHTEGEVNANSMVSSVINSAIQNLNTRSTSAIISNTISNLNNYNPSSIHNNFPNNATVAADGDILIL